MVKQTLDDWFYLLRLLLTKNIYCCKLLTIHSLSVSVSFSESTDAYRTTLDPGFRRDDDFEGDSIFKHRTSFIPPAFETSSRRRPGSSVFT